MAGRTPMDAHGRRLEQLGVVAALGHQLPVGADGLDRMEPIGAAHTLSRFSSPGGQTLRGPDRRWYIGGEPVLSTPSNPAPSVAAPKEPLPSRAGAGRSTPATGADGTGVPAVDRVLGTLGRLDTEGTSRAGGAGPSAGCPWAAKATAVSPSRSQRVVMPGMLVNPGAALSPM